ncbi:uroporphyrinogen decarboxylase [Helicobacter sp. MIT 14-3879]|uniref:uroporphyrinogen decarboxylase n=1 Tax=Helicobacter sp. MIT 14-3879 TaxID=2040649 RepID=UPI000E1F1BF0|nr:uroporphyrinogen decarboxylase [Helicobacter sp. MIT 14-3879]RDU65487.1 uroporphyrinogen decarboxylase [Helicobacter sp. MIT 14-3879]
MIFIDACNRKQTPYTPIWMMRQAGRYLSEYREVRLKAGSFLDLCKNTELASKVTLQPIDILDCDAAILFSDILVVPLEMGMKLNFVKNEGPKFETCIRSEKDFSILQNNIGSKLSYVYDTISVIRSKLSKQKALIGFCGAPWTLATYMVEGEGSKTYANCKKMLYTNPKLLHNILQSVSNELKSYLESQIKAGVDSVMLFDSWAGALEPSSYFEFGFNYIIDISKYIKSKFPNIPIIVFPKGVGGYLHKFVDIKAYFDVFGVDWETSMAYAKEVLGDKYVLQGNLEPMRLYNENSMINGIDEIVSIMGKKEGHIFNLGHGMLPDLPRENAIKLVQLVKEKTKR